MDKISADGFGAPVRWMLAFRRETDTWWVKLLAWGEFKHVRAFAFVAETDTWIFYDVGWGKTTMLLARGAGARRLMLQWTENSTVLAMPALGQFVRWPPAFVCTAAIRHLIGLPGGTLRPNALYRDCLAHGAEIVDGQAASDSADRRDT